jgi:hypothetical protein
MITTCFQVTYFVALHKSATDLLELHPIDINSTCLHCLIFTISLAHLSNDFAAHLLPGGQVGISIHGSIITIVHLSCLMLKTFISCPLSANLPPTHAMLLLDIFNMFNVISSESSSKAMKPSPASSHYLTFYMMMPTPAGSSPWITSGRTSTSLSGQTDICFQIHEIHSHLELFVLYFTF